MTSAVRGKAFLSLLARPAVLFFGLTWVVATLLAAELAHRVDSWLLIAVLTPVPSGMIASQLFVEVQHATFAWTLPRLRQAMATPLAAMTLVWAFAIGMLAQRFGGGASPAEVFGCAAFAVLGFWLGVVVFDPLRGLLPIAVGLAVALWARGTGGAGGDIPLTASLVALATAIWCARSALSREILRQRPLRPTLTFSNSHMPAVVARYRLEKLAASGYRQADSWHYSLTNATPRTWVLASFFERRAFGWKAAWQLAVYAVLGVVAVLLLPEQKYLLLWIFGHLVTADRIELARDLYQTLVTPTGGMHGSLAFLVAAIVCGPFGSLPFPRVGLLPQVSHPLSRRSRGQVTWMSQWLMTSLIAAAVTVVLVGVAWGAGTFADLTRPAGRLPGVVAPLVFGLSMVPFLLWRATKAEWRMRADAMPAAWGVMNGVIWFLILIGCGYVSSLSTRVLVNVHPITQLAGWMTWLAAALALHRWLVTRHFRQADLL